MLIKTIFHKREPLEQWASKNLVYIEERYLSVIREEDTEELHMLAELCHHLVTDRDVIRFTLEEREDLYRRWLSSKQSCIMAVNDDTNMIVGASIIIPLKKTAYLDFCEGSLDALKIKASHIAGVSEKQDQRFLLVDMLCRHPQLSSAFSGIAFRSLIRHIALFYEPLKQKPPVIFCSTENKKLLSRLDALEFERGAKELNTEAYIYSTDLGKQQFKSPQVRAYYTHLIELCRFYNQENSI